MKTTIIAIACGILMISAIQSPADEARQVRVPSVIGFKRPLKSDVIVLRNGEKLFGKILNKSVSITTPYGSVTIKSAMLAGIDLDDDENNLDLVFTIDKSRFSGFVETRELRIELKSGEEMKVRKEDAVKAVFAIRADESNLPPISQFLLLRNGDFFGGQLNPHRLTIHTAEKSVEVKIADAQTVIFGRGDVATKVVLSSGELAQGRWAAEDVNVDLDLGGSVRLHPDRLKMLFCKPDAIPVEMLAMRRIRRVAAGAAASSTPRATESSTVQAPAPQEKSETAAASQPEPTPRPAAPRSYEDRKALADFENCPEEINDAYAGLSFSDDWRAMKSGNPDYRVNGRVATAGDKALITLADPVTQFQAYGTSPDQPSEAIARDENGEVVARTHFNGMDQAFQLKADTARIKSVEIAGPRFQWVIDDITTE